MNRNYISNSNIEVNYFDKVGIQFVGISIDELLTMNSSYKPFLKKYNSEPDIIVRFVDEIKTSNVTYLGLDYAAFDNDNFYLISDPVKKKKVLIPFDKIGQSLEIVCEKGINSIPLLNHIINFYLIKKNLVPIHSSGFYYNGKGILVMGWTKGGKTETLLSFATHGAEYVGDEWVVLSQNGSDMIGLNVPVTIWKWQLPYIKELVNSVGMTDKIIFVFVSLLEFINNLILKLKLESKFPFKIFNQVLPHAKKLLRIRKKPESLFHKKIRPGKTRLDALILAMSHESDEVIVNGCKSEEVINRMIHSNDYEQIPFFEFYKVFKYAFPGRVNEFLENIKKLHSELLLNALKDKKSYKISHPYPVTFESLFNNLNKAIF